jgi:hypothetical protein
MDLSTLCAEMAALSVAVERVVEIVKQMCGTWPLVGLLFTPQTSKGRENVRCACIYLLSGTIGGVVAANTSIGAQLLPGANRYFADVISGALASGGSAFWNHALDLLQAAKVAKEQSAAALVAANIAAPVMAGVPAGD